MCFLFKYTDVFKNHRSVFRFFFYVGVKQASFKLRFRSEKCGIIQFLFWSTFWPNVKLILHQKQIDIRANKKIISIIPFVL